MTEPTGMAWSAEPMGAAALAGPVPRPDRGRELLTALVVAVAVATAGVGLGFLWHLLAPTLPLRKVEGGLAYITPNPEEQIAQDGWFAGLGLAFGIVAAVLVWTLLRRWRGPVQLFAVALGALAAGFMAWEVGSQIGLADYQARVASAPLETVVQRPADLYATKTQTCLLGRCVTTRGGSLFVPALGAVIGYSLLAGWSRWPSLRREEDEAELSSFPEWAPAAAASPEPPAPR